jgi:periplasmic mercuric ion binding protein
MKKVKFIVTAMLAVVMGVNSLAQMHDHSKMSTTKTETIKVWGNCEACQARIEKTAKTEGVTKASWNKDKQVLTLVYDSSKVKSDDVQKKLAAVGHDTEKYKADDKAYNSLPGCCKYPRKK